MTGIYLSELSHRQTRSIRGAYEVLSGIVSDRAYYLAPVVVLRLGVFAAGVLVLSVMSIPTSLGATRSALAQVPRLGSGRGTRASRRKIVLKTAMPGITGMLSRWPQTTDCAAAVHGGGRPPPDNFTDSPVGYLTTQFGRAQPPSVAQICPMTRPFVDVPRWLIFIGRLDQLVVVAGALGRLSLRAPSRWPPSFHEQAETPSLVQHLGWSLCKCLPTSEFGVDRSRNCPRRCRGSGPIESPAIESTTWPAILSSRACTTFRVQHL